MAKVRLTFYSGRATITARKLVRPSVARTTRRTLNGSAVKCPVDTGNLRASGEMSINSGPRAVTGEVVYRAKYAAAVHNGRKALTIRPTRANGRLRFVVDGRVVFAREVHQPARPGNPFLTDALREVGAADGFVVTTR